MKLRVGRSTGGDHPDLDRLEVLAQVVEVSSEKLTKDEKLQIYLH